MIKNSYSNYFALEGPAFAGKTTILSYIKDHHGEELSVVPESSEFVGGDCNFPAVPFSSFDDAKASTQFFIELEKQRCLVARKLYSKRNVPVILDRATLLSSVLFYSLLEHEFPQLHSFSDSMVQHSLEIFEKELSKGSFFIPENLILVKPKDRAVFEARLKRGTKNNMYGSWSSVNFLLTEYQKIIEAHYPAANVLYLETDNTAANLRLCAKKIMEFISMPKPPNPMDALFSHFQGAVIRHQYCPDCLIEEKQYESVRQNVKTLIGKAACN